MVFTWVIEIGTDKTDFMEWYIYIEKGFWFGIAAIGFSILFNVPQRTIPPIFALGILGGLTKLWLIKIGYGPVIGSFAGATLIGALSHLAGWWKVSPPIVFSIPASIPMVPGVFTYRMMVGLIKLASRPVDSEYTTILNDTVHNGMLALFILISLAVGAALPLLLVRKKSGRELEGILKSNE